MSDCRNGGRDVYAAPRREDREPGVLYQHALYSHEYYEGLSAIEVSGVRFHRDPPVRCAGCAHSRVEAHAGDEELVCWRRETHGEAVPPDHYCGYGSPREGAAAAAPGGGECEQVLTDCDDGLMPPFTAHCSKCGKQWGITPKYCPECGAKVTGTRDERKAVKR